MATNSEPREVREFDVIEPSGRWRHFRYKTRMERFGAGTTLCIALILSGMIWLALSAWVWRIISALFQ